jgi:hypothetical protein
MQFVVINVSKPQACYFPRVIPEIDIWRAANLMLKRSRRSHPASLLSRRSAPLLCGHAWAVTAAH